MLQMSRFILTRRMSLPVVQVLRTQSTVPLKQSSQNITESNVRPFIDIPGPNGLPFFGSIHRYIMAGGIQNMHKVNQKLFEEFGPIFKETLFGQTIVHVLDPEDSAKVFRSEGKYPRRQFFESMMKVLDEERIQSMLTRDGPEWKHLRKAVQSKMMRPKELYDNIQSFNQVVDEALDSIRRARGHGTSEGEIPTLSQELSKWAMESIGVLVFDAKIGLYDDPPSQEAVESIQAVENLFKASHSLEFGMEKIFFKLKFNTPSLKMLRENLIFGRKFAKKYVKAKMDEMKEDSEDPETLLYGKAAVPLLSFLLAKGDLSVDEIADSCVDMFLGGVDTTSTLMAWALYRLATNQDVQERLRHEILTVTGKDGELAPNDMGKIPYMKACMKEVLRLDGIAMANNRILDQDVVLSGYNIPAGIPVMPNIYSTARSESYFKDAEAFKPERWLRDSEEEFHPFSFLPFGFGPRMCIGRRTAELEVILFLSKVVQRFKLEYNHKPLEKVLTLVLQPEDKNIKINFIDRN